MCGWRFCCIFICALSLATDIVWSGQRLMRNKRFLIFPQQAPTRHQFIAGIGIPADLDYESLTVGHVLKAQFYLPYNATVFRENPYWPEYRNDYNRSWREPDADGHLQARRSALRWDLYAYLEHRLASYGYNGRECLLRAICEANAVHLAQHHNIFAEVLHMFLSPSSSADLPTADSLNFLEAERLGLTAGTCHIYACRLSLLDWVSQVLKVF